MTNLRTNRNNFTSVNMSYTSNTIQNKNCVEAVYSKDLIPFIKIENTKDDNELVVGERYALGYKSCDGIEIPRKVYEIHAVIEIFKSKPLYCVVAKQIEGPTSTIYEINRSICNDLGIDYESNLQLLPMAMNWEKITAEISDEVEFNPNDMSTYPSQGGYVNFIVVKLSGFASYRPTHIITSNGTTLTSKEFLKTFSVTFQYDVDGDKSLVEIGKTVKHSIITNELEEFAVGHPHINPRKGCLCNENGDMYVRLDLSGLRIKPEMLKDKTINDLFLFSWVETKTLDEPQLLYPKTEFDDFHDLISSIGQTFEDTFTERPPFEVKEGMVRRDSYGRFEIFDGYRWRRTSEQSLRGKDYRLVNVSQN